MAHFYFLSAVHEFHVFQVLLLLAIVAAYHASLAVFHMEKRRHGVVVGDTLRIGALDDALDIFGQSHAFLLHDLKILDDAERNIGRNNRKQIKLGVRKIFVRHLDDTLASHLDRKSVV